VNHQKEIEKNGYEVLRGKSLIDYKLVYSKTFGNETDFVIKITHIFWYMSKMITVNKALFKGQNN